MDGSPADGAVERYRCLDGFWRGLRSPDDLDQWHDVWRIKGMANDAALRMRALRLNCAHRETCRAGSNDHVNGRRCAQIREQLDLEIDLFGGALLHEVGVFDGER